MKKLVWTLLCISILLLQLTGCPLDESGVPPVAMAPDILITVGEVTPGMTVGQIPVEVTLNGEPAACTVEWVIFSEDGFGYLEPTDTILEGYYGRLDVTYFLPKGVEVTGDLPIAVNAPGGTYDGTGEGATNEEGCHAAWSHIMYELPKAVAAPEILITVPELKPGMTVGQIPVEVTLNGEPADCTTSWVIFSEDGFGYLEPTDTIPEGYYGRLDVTYFLPKGVEVTGDLPVTLNAPGGTYDGTGEGATNEDGCHAAWSHIMYELSEKEKPHTHDWKTNKAKSKAATCEEEGLKYLECSCGEHKTSKVKATGHDYEGKVTKEPTCEETGVRTYTCKNCGDSYTEKIKENGHDYEGKVTKEPTCEETGVRTYTCKNCGDSYTEKIKENGHDYSGKVTKEPTCEESGMRTYTCKDCGDTYTEKVGMKEHKWSNFTYSNNRVHIRQCESCGEEESEKHSFKDNTGLCVVCNEYIIN